MSDRLAERRQGPGRPAAHPGALPARPRPGPPRGRRRAPSACPPDQVLERPQGAAHVRAAGRLPRRPHRRRPRRPRGPGGRRRHPGLQRRLPGPPAAAHPDRGDRDHRGAARAAQRRRRRDPRGRRPGAVQAGGGRRRAARPPPGSTRGTSTADADLARPRRPGSRTPSTARSRSRLTYFVPSRDEESERVVDPRGIVSAHGFTYLDAWCHSAEAPRLFRLDRIQPRPQVLEQPDRDHPRGPTRPGRRPVRPRPATPPWSRSGWSARPAGSSSTTRSRRSAPAAAGVLEVDLRGRQRALAAAAAAPARPARAGARPGRLRRRVHSRRTGHPQPLPLTRRTMKPFQTYT